MSAKPTLDDPRNGPIQRLMDWLADDDKRTTYLAFPEPEARVLGARLNDLQWRVDQLHASWVEASNEARRYGQIVDWMSEYNPRLLALCPFKTDGTTVVRPSEPCTGSQAGLSGPSGSPTSHREHATDGSPCWCEPERFDYTNGYVKQLEDRHEEAFQMARAVVEAAQGYLRIGGESVSREARAVEQREPDGGDAPVL